MNKIISDDESHEKGKQGLRMGGGEDKKVRKDFLDKATFEKS